MFKKSLKRIVASVLTVAMMFTMSASVFASEESELKGTNYTTADGKEFFVPTTNVTSIAPQLVGDPPEDSGISGYNYHNDWQKVSNVSSRPYNGIVKVISHYRNGTSYSATGFVVGDGRILTAGHAIYHDAIKSWVSSVTVEFRKNGGSVYKRVETSKVAVPSSWVDVVEGRNQSEGAVFLNDYGVIVVPSSYTTDATKFGLSIGVYQGTNYTISGYPNSGPYASAAYMYTDTNTIQYDWGYTVRHSIDVMNGVSGAPMYGSNIYAVGIQTRGYSLIADDSKPTDQYVGTGGFATPITASVVSLVNADF